MPNRILKETICTSENLALLSAEEEVFFYRLIVNCDDFGRMDARPQVLLAKCFPLKVLDIPLERITEWLSALERAGLILLYEAEGGRYLQLRTWEKHQRVRNKKSRYPAPPDPLTIDSNCQHLTAIDSNCRQLSSIDSNCLPESNPIQSESNPSLNQENPVQSQRESSFSSSQDPGALGGILGRVIEGIGGSPKGKEGLYKLAVKAKVAGMSDEEYGKLLERIAGTSSDFEDLEKEIKLMMVRRRENEREKLCFA